MSLEDSQQEGITGDTAAQDQNESFGEIALATSTQEQSETNDGNSPSDEIGNSVSKLGEDFAVSESMETEAISTEADVGMNLDAISGEEEEQQQQQQQQQQQLSSPIPIAHVTIFGLCNLFRRDHCHKVGTISGSRLL